MLVDGLIVCRFVVDERFWQMVQRFGEVGKAKERRERLGAGWGTEWSGQLKGQVQAQTIHPRTSNKKAGRAIRVPRLGKVEQEKM